MRIRVSRFPLQRFVQRLPKPLRRLRIAKLIARLTGSPYHRIGFQCGEVIADVRDNEAANSLVQGVFADYGYFDLARQLLSAGEVHLDVGANYGFHTFGPLGAPFGKALRYVLVEANPGCAACLRESAAAQPETQLHIFHSAAAAAPGEIRFSFASSVTGSGHVGEADGAQSTALTVPAAALDDLLAGIDCPHVRLMKMDIEGSETSALRGLSQMLSAHRVDFIYFEVNPDALALQESSPTELFDELSRHGYRLFWPHTDLAWISRTLARPDLRNSDLKCHALPGAKPHTIAEFDRSLYQPGQFGQCDLLAVSPTCPLQALPATGC
jgi:FkbM family methyltransferase